MRVGVVTEGPSDYLALKSLLGHVAPDIVPEHVWPDTQVGGRPYGWRGVRSWCEDHCDRLEPLMRGVIRSKDGDVKKPLKRYAPLTRAVALNWERVAQTCPQAARCALDSAAAATAVAHGCWSVA